MLKCLIIDDEPLAVKLLNDYVTTCQHTSLAASFNNPITALQALDQLDLDLILLDVQMPELTGVQFAKIIQGKYPVILTTAYEEYALEGYQLDIVDYLLKPVSYARFEEAILRAQQRIKPEPLPSPSTSVADVNTNYIFIKSGYKTQRISLADILYIEGLSDYIRIFTATESLLTLDTLKGFEQKLPSSQFMRIHKSYIIGIDKIDFIENNRVVITDKHLPIGGTYQDRFWKRIGRK